MLCANKDGKGDGTGTIDAEVLPLVGQYFTGDAARLAEIRQANLVAFQMRCESSPTSVMLPVFTS